MFSRQHYVAISDVLRMWADSNGKIKAITIANALATMFEQDNPQFDRPKFIQACTKHDSRGE